MKDAMRAKYLNVYASHECGDIKLCHKARIIHSVLKNKKYKYIVAITVDGEEGVALCDKEGKFSVSSPDNQRHDFFLEIPKN